MQTINPRKDFLIGFLGFFGFNLALLLLLWAMGAGMNVLPKSISTSAAANNIAIFLFCCFPGLANLGALIFAFIQRRWMALGALIAIGVSIIGAGIALAALLASGFTLV